MLVDKFKDIEQEKMFNVTKFFLFCFFCWEQIGAGARVTGETVSAVLLFMWPAEQFYRITGFADFQLAWNLLLKSQSFPNTGFQNFFFIVLVCFFFVRVCVEGICVQMCVLSTHTYVSPCEGQRLALDVFLFHSLFYLLSLNLKLTALFGQADVPVSSQDLLSLLPNAWIFL